MKAFLAPALAAFALMTSANAPAHATPNQDDTFTFQLDATEIRAAATKGTLKERLAQNAHQHCAAMANRSIGQFTSRRGYIAACTRQLESETLARVARKNADARERLAKK